MYCIFQLKHKCNNTLNYVNTFFYSSAFSKQVKQKVSATNLVIQTLEEEVTYIFNVRAQTIDYGPPIVGNVTTGPQEGSPFKPKDLVISKTMYSVDLRWVNGQSGKGPIIGYYIQCRRKGKPKTWISNIFDYFIGDLKLLLSVVVLNRRYCK